jgi:hypothetical protein
MIIDPEQRRAKLLAKKDDGGFLSFALRSADRPEDLQNAGPEVGRELRACHQSHSCPHHESDKALLLA